MTDSQPHTANPPTPKQLSYLRGLALGRGQSFAYPRTRAQASAEIKRLEATKRTPASDRQRETRAVRDDMSRSRGDAAHVRPEELGGYGSSAHWKSRS